MSGKPLSRRRVRESGFPDTGRRCGGQPTWWSQLTGAPSPARRKGSSAASHAEPSRSCTRSATWLPDAVVQQGPQLVLTDDDVAVRARAPPPEPQRRGVAEPLAVDAWARFFGDLEPQHRPRPQSTGERAGAAHWVRTRCTRCAAGPGQPAVQSTRAIPESRARRRSPTRRADTPLSATSGRRSRRVCSLQTSAVDEERLPLRPRVTVDRVKRPWPGPVDGIRHGSSDQCARFAAIRQVLATWPIGRACRSQNDGVRCVKRDTAVDRRLPLRSRRTSSMLRTSPCLLSSARTSVPRGTRRT